MPRVLKYFILGMSKTLDIGNTTKIYRRKSTNNIKQSWQNVGLSMEKSILLEKENERTSKSRVY